MTTATPASETKSPQRRLHGPKIGVVIGDKRDKTRSVAVTYQVRTPKYGKFIKRQTKYHVHDEKNASKIGDVVDSNLKTQHDNLYVCDCSVIPEAWGLPPTLTILGLGKRLSKHLLREHA